MILKRLHTIFIFFALLSCEIVDAQFVVGTDEAHPSAIMELSSNEKGLLIPTLTTIARVGMNVGNPKPGNGMLVFDTDSNQLFYYNSDSSRWFSLHPWLTSAASPNSTISIVPTGNLGINTDTPKVKLDVVGSVGANEFRGRGIAPIGLILMWSGSTSNIPSGWALCDGQNGTPNLTGRFIVGAGTAPNYKIKNNTRTFTDSVTYTTGNTGGADVVQLSNKNMGLHQHTSAQNTSSPVGNHQHKYRKTAFGGTECIDCSNMGDDEWTQNYGQGSTGDNYWTDNAGAHTHTTSGTTSSVGTTSTVYLDNLPPYYALAFIMRIQ